MFAIIVYDIKEERVNKVRIYLKQWMDWVQNSVFEGELTKAELMIVEQGLKDIIDKKEDSVRFYILRDKKFAEIKEIGKAKVDPSNII